MRVVEQRYQNALNAIPMPGGGGCHAALLGVASLGIMTGRSDDMLLSEIKQAIPQGQRRVLDREIGEAIRRAHKDTAPMSTNRPRPRVILPPRRNRIEMIGEALKNPAHAASFQARMIEIGGNEFDPEGADAWENSSIRIEAYTKRFPYAADVLLLLKYLYHPGSILFIGNRYDAGSEHIKTAAEWLDYFQRSLAWIKKQPANYQQSCFERLGNKFPHIIPNPLTGQSGTVKGGDKQTLRGDDCVKEFRYVVAEFDDLPMLKQGAVLRGLCSIGWKIAAIIHSGGRSCHAWLVVDEKISNYDEWTQRVKNALFPMLAALGVDKACSNPARLSRLPGVFRSDKSNWQRLLYLAPEGGML